MFKTNTVTLPLVYFSVILAIITGILVGMLSPIYGMAVIMFLILFTLLFSNLCYGIIFWIVIGGVFVLPLYRFRNAGLYPSIVILSLLFIFWLFLSVEKGTLGITRSRLFWPLSMFLLIVILSSLKGNILYDPNVAGEHYFILVQIFASIIVIFSILTAFLIARFFKTAGQIRLIYFALIILGIELIVFDLFRLSKYGYFPQWPTMMQAHAMSICFSSLDRKSTRLNSSHIPLSRMPSSA